MNCWVCLKVFPHSRPLVNTVCLASLYNAKKYLRHSKHPTSQPPPPPAYSLPPHLQSPQERLQQPHYPSSYLPRRYWRDHRWLPAASPVCIAGGSAGHWSWWCPVGCPPGSASWSSSPTRSAAPSCARSRSDPWRRTSTPTDTHGTQVTCVHWANHVNTIST